MGNQVPGLIKGFHNSRLQGPFLSCSQVLLQLFQAGHAQDDGIPESSLQGKTANVNTFLLPRGSSQTLLLALPLPRFEIYIYLYLSDLCPVYPEKIEGAFVLPPAHPHRPK
jgi:hypothetical protein